jgi:phage N-6-adenine-methyltransferase
MNNVHYSSKTDDWATPQDFFDKIQREFHLDHDVCADETNAKLPRYFSKQYDGLKCNWSGLRCWMNPPYGRKIGKWVQKASEGGAALVVALLPARTDTKYFHDYIYNKPNVEIRFIKGRLKFGDSKNSAPFPSMLVIFK